MTMTTKYVSQKDGNVLIRKALKAAFPTVKFSVRGESYSGGASTTVNYVDGPPVKMVKAITDQFEGTTFDGMIDLASPKAQVLNGEPVHYMTDYVFVNRHLSEQAEAEAKALLEAEGIDTTDGWRTLGSTIPQAAYRFGYVGWDGHNVATWVRMLANLMLDAQWTKEEVMA